VDGRLPLGGGGYSLEREGWRWGRAIPGLSPARS